MKAFSFLARVGVTLAVLALALNACSEKYALLVGVESYKETDLINPLQAACADAKGLASVLEQVGGYSPVNVRVLTSDATDEHLLPTGGNIVFELGQLQSKLKPGDTVFVLFSGHGMFVNGGSYFLPYDADIRNDASLMHSAVSDNDIRTNLEDLPASAEIIAYDVCRSDPHRSKDDGTNDLVVGEEKRLVLQPKSITGKGPDSVVILFSCSPNKRSYEWGSMKRGYFSYFLEQGLRKEAADSTGTVHVSNLVAYLQKAVLATVSREEGQEENPYPEILGPGANDLVVAIGLPPGNGGAEAQAVVTNPNDKLYAQAYQQAMDLVNAKKYEEAQQEFLNAAAVKETVLAGTMAGRCARLRKDFESGEKLYRKAIMLDPSFAPAFNNLGALLNLMKSDPDEAERLLRKATELNPNDAVAVNNLGSLYEDQGKYDEAESCFRRSMILDPTSGEPVRNLGSFFFNLRKDYTAAELWYRKGIELDSTDGEMYANLACALFKEGKRDEATTDAKKAIALGDKDCWVFKELGLDPGR